MPNQASFEPEEIQQALCGTRVAGPERATAGVSTDTRTVGTGELFVAIRGPRFDGHDFVGEAFARGASAVVVERWPLKGLPAEFPGTVWKVDDALAALGMLARVHRSRFSVPVVAITGSSGKSTTKEILAQLLSAEGRSILATPGTQNNRIGVPATLFQLGRWHAAAVLELGTNQWGEIRTLAQISRPTLGVVTQIGPAHLETFGDLRGVLKEKAALWEEMDPSAPIVLNGDDPLLREAARELRRPVVWFGTGADAQIRATRIETDSEGSRCRVNDRWDLALPLPGLHNLFNALAALACVQRLGEDLGGAVARLRDVRGLPGRLAVSERDGVRWIDDTYNANPASVRVALDFFQKMDRAGRKALVLGDMLELGEESEQIHAQIGALAGRSRLDLLVAVGRFAPALVQAAQQAGLPAEKSRVAVTAEEARNLLWEWVRPGDAVLVKGSRGMRMERVLECCTTSSTP